jgi:hypothetical protein
MNYGSIKENEPCPMNYEQQWQHNTIATTQLQQQQHNCNSNNTIATSTTATNDIKVF